MANTITIDRATITVANKVFNESFDIGTMTTETIIEAIRLGLSTKLQNSYASAKLDGLDEAGKAKRAVECAERIRAGEWNAAGGGRTADPVAAEMKRLASGIAVKANKDKDSDEYKAAFTAAMANPKLRTVAERRVAEAAELADM